MALRLIYQMFTKLLGWIVLRTRSDTTKDIEILVLRHELAVLKRRTPRPRMTWTDRALIAVLTCRVPPCDRWCLPSLVPDLYLAYRPTRPHPTLRHASAERDMGLSKQARRSREFSGFLGASGRPTVRGRPRPGHVQGKASASVSIRFGACPQPRLSALLPVHRFVIDPLDVDLLAGAVDVVVYGPATLLERPVVVDDGVAPG